MRLEYLDGFRFITEIIVDILNDSTEIIVSVGEFKIKVRYNLIYTNSFINIDKRDFKETLKGYILTYLEYNPKNRRYSTNLRELIEEDIDKVIIYIRLYYGNIVFE